MDEMRPGDLLAPDGIIIRPIAGVDSPLLSVVVGIIPPRPDWYSVHLHYSLDQVTYVLRGPATVSYLSAGQFAPTTVTLQTGEAITTPSLTTLSFRNDGAEPAEVLFICVPPYPATDADTELIPGSHRVPSADEMARAVERHRQAGEYLATVLAARLQTLRWQLPADLQD